MKLSVGVRSRRWAGVAAVLTLLIVMAITGAFSQPAGARAPRGAVATAPASREISPGLARAETDTLDLQLD